MRYTDSPATSIAYERPLLVGLCRQRSAVVKAVMMQLRQTELTWHVAGDDVVVLDLQGSVYLTLNGSARVLWERLSEPCEEADLVAALVAAYGIEESRAAADVADFLADLRRRDLLA
jgi:hypothetical protein